MRTRDLCDLLSDQATAFLDEQVSKLNREVSESVLVEFINFVARRQGVEYGLHSKDFESPSQVSLFPSCRMAPRN